MANKRSALWFGEPVAREQNGTRFAGCAMQIALFLNASLLRHDPVRS